eukprot:832953-Prymnesium_polylepis.1
MLVSCARALASATCALICTSCCVGGSVPARISNPEGVSPTFGGGAGEYTGLPGVLKSAVYWV